MMLSVDAIVADAKDALQEFLDAPMPEDEGLVEVETRRRATAAVAHVRITLDQIAASHGPVIAGIAAEEFDEIVGRLTPLSGGMTH
jgi:hypothetical protein